MYIKHSIERSKPFEMVETIFDVQGIRLPFKLKDQFQKSLGNVDRFTK